ncbi:MAG: hypothetical protein PHD01_17600 [Geobacteraceae bacterium]|nr:hypothetical protein [Geobacteraceae bacterium]
MKSLGKSRLIKGMIIPPTHVELIAVDHCNISCNICNHASPLMPSWFADPDTIHRDFSILSKYYRPKFVKVIGGEPLLHNHLDAVIQAARATDISDYFKLTTNGLLLHKATDAIWEAVDEVEISLYPGLTLAEKNIRLAMEKAEVFGKKLTIYYYEQFRETFSLKGTSDNALVNRVYAACKIANVWGCHAVRGGFFHKCPQSIYAAMLTGKGESTDRIPIVDSAAFQVALLEYVNSAVPLSACVNCVGTVGSYKTHALMPLNQIPVDIDKPMEELVDYDWLERSLITQDTYDDCKIPSRLGVSRALIKHPMLQRFYRTFWPKHLYHDFLVLSKPPVRQSAAKTHQKRPK